MESFTNLTDKIASLTEENARLQDKFDSISGENRNLLDSLQTRIDQVAQLKSELESVKLVNAQISYIYPNLKNKQTKKNTPNTKLEQGSFREYPLRERGRVVAAKERQRRAESNS